ncbi:MAG: tetratricopeptide repeat protein [Kiritimatiellae bacterium]|nr:tetratricopeptide repeat protein [Kiritimatiellia bacterium]
MRSLFIGLLVLLSGCSLLRKPTGTQDLQLSESEQIFASALGQYARALVAEGEEGRSSDVVFDALERATELDPGRARLHRKLANTALRRRDNKTAIEALDQLRLYHPESAQAHFELAALHQVLGHLDQAAELYYQSSQLAPIRTHAYWQHAQIRLSQNRDAEAMQILAEGFEKAGSPEALATQLTVLATHWTREKNFERAITFFSFLAEHYKRGSSDFLQVVAQIQEQQGDTEAALKTLKSALQIDPAHSSSFSRLAALQLRQTPAVGINTLKEGLEAFPKNVEMLLMLAYANLNMGNYQDAADTFESIRGLVAEIKQTSLTPDFYILYASACEELNRHDDMENLLLECIKLYPEEVESLNYLAYTWALQARRLDEALDLVNRALKKDPDNGAYIDTRGWVYFQQRQYNKALEDLLRANTLVKGDPTILDHIGDTYQSLGNSSEAIKYWLQSLTKAPGNAAIEQKLRESGIPAEQIPQKIEDHSDDNAHTKPQQ